MIGLSLCFTDHDKNPKGVLLMFYPGFRAFWMKIKFERSQQIKPSDTGPFEKVVPQTGQKTLSAKKSQEKLKRFMMIFFKNRPPELLLNMRYRPIKVTIYQKG